MEVGNNVILKGIRYNNKVYLYQIVKLVKNCVTGWKFLLQINLLGLNNSTQGGRACNCQLNKYI